MVASVNNGCYSSVRKVNVETLVFRRCDTVGYTKNNRTGVAESNMRIENDAKQKSQNRILTVESILQVPRVRVEAL